jgi:uncharacterized protein
MPTLNDIMSELAKPGRDPRSQFESFNFSENVQKVEDLKPGMKLPGIVTNIAAFGVFVDIGVHQDGLIHISELADRFVKDPAEVVKVQQKVTVTVMEVDLQRKRISLSLKNSRTKTETSDKIDAAKNMKDPSQQPGRQKKEPERFASNPFYEALKKKLD